MTRRPALIGLIALLLAAGASAAAAQSLSLDLGEGGSSTSRILQLLALLTVLSLAPSILIMVTSFTRIVIVLSFLRSAIGLQQTPPNTVLVSLALFLSAFIMAPVLEQSYRDGIRPLMKEQISEIQAFDRAVAPVHRFMMAHTRDKDLTLFMNMSEKHEVDAPSDTPLQALIPAFLISELRRAFEIGFLLFVPFVIIDMVVASILMSMGMMMLPPVMISLPFKLIFFVLVDGWYMVAGSLVQSYGT
jgi:flagellar biosynthetic protein FliP